MAIWTNGGTLVVDGSGKPIECATCPCEESPCVTECCITGSLTTTLIVDLGADPLGNESCNSCENVAGEFEITAIGECVWEGEFDYECGAVGNVDCFPPRTIPYNGFRVIINASLNTTTCTWTVSIVMKYLLDGELVGFDDSCSGPGSAVYASAGDDIDCDGTDTTLTKSFSSIGGTACVDNMPATITIRTV